MKTKKATSVGGFLKMAGWTGLEPAASAVTGRRYNQLNYHPAMAIDSLVQREKIDIGILFSLFNNYFTEIRDFLCLVFQLRGDARRHD